MERMDDMERHERIEAYVRGRMSEPDRASFEADMTADAELRDAVELERTMQDVLMQEKNMRFRDLVKEVSDELDKEQTNVHDMEHGGRPMEVVPEEATVNKTEVPVIPIDRKRNWGWLAAAASVALVGSYAVFTTIADDPFNERTMAVVEVYHFGTTRGGGDAGQELERIDHELTALLRQGAFQDYLSKSAEVLKTDSAFRVQFGMDVRRDRALVLLRQSNAQEAKKEASILEAEYSDCSAIVIEGLAFGLDGDADKARELLRSADSKGCLDPKAKDLFN